jgi:hypothetical protein
LLHLLATGYGPMSDISLSSQLSGFSKSIADA